MTYCCKHLNKINDTGIHPDCDGRYTSYRTPLVCCGNGDYVECPAPPCKMHIAGRRKESGKKFAIVDPGSEIYDFYPYESDDPVIPQLPSHAITNYARMIWDYEGNILSCGGTSNMAGDCWLAKPENDYAWETFPALPYPRSQAGYCTIGGVPWIIGGRDASDPVTATHYFDKVTIFSIHYYGNLLTTYFLQIATDWLPGPTFTQGTWESRCLDIDGTLGIISGGRIAAGYLFDVRLLDTTSGNMHFDPYPGGNHLSQHTNHWLQRVTLNDGNEYIITIAGSYGF